MENEEGERSDGDAVPDALAVQESQTGAPDKDVGEVRHVIQPDAHLSKRHRGANSRHDMWTSS